MLRTLRSTFRLIVPAAAALTLVAACAPSPGGGGGGGGSGGGDNTLVIGMTASDIPLLDTGLSQNQGYEGIRFVGNQLYDGLTKFDLQQGDEIPKVIPDLATEWTVDEAGTTWTFTLREGVTFHDGTPWDADAAIFNLDRTINEASPDFYPELNAQAGLSIAGIVSAAKVDDMTIAITTDGPLSYLPSNLTTVFFGSPTAIKDKGNEGFGQEPVGTGPFAFESYQRGQQLALTANADYWAGKPGVDKVVLRPIPDATARVAALRAGQVNWIEVPPPDDVASLTDDDYQVLTNSYDHSWPWVLDVSKAPWNDVRVRQAANYAINRESLIDNVLQGTADPAGQVAPKANAGYQEGNDVYTYDPDKAKQLLAEAGLPDGFSTTLSYPTSGSGNMLPTPMNEALQADLAAVGIQVELQPVEWASMLTDFFQAQIPGGADAINISLSMQQEGFWNTWFGTDSSSNAGKYSNPQVDQLLTDAKGEFDDAARADIYAQVSTLLTDDAAWLTVVNDRNPRVLAPNVKGFIQPKSWFADLTTITVE
jgi:peptide/nickel transport system substrate-binding protein